MIFLIDDKPEESKDIINAIRVAGYHVDVFSSISVAQSKYYELRPQIIISDQNLGGSTSGIGVIDDAVKKLPGVIVILISSSWRVADIAEDHNILFFHKTEEKRLIDYLSEIL